MGSVRSFGAPASHAFYRAVKTDEFFSIFWIFFYFSNKVFQRTYFFRGFVTFLLYLCFLFCPCFSSLSLSLSLSLPFFVFFFFLFLSFFSFFQTLSQISMWGVEEEKSLIVKDEAEFRNRLKKSFSAGESSEIFVASQECLICCESLTVGRARLVRKCLASAHPCSGHACDCSVTYCESCLVSLLWKSPRSHKGLGRYRAGCPFCKAEFCHFDVARVVFEGKPKAVSRLALPRVCSAGELQSIKAYQRAASEGEGFVFSFILLGKSFIVDLTGADNIVVRFAFSNLQRLEVSLSSTERKQAHQVF